MNMQKPKLKGKSKQFLKNMVDSASPLQLVVLLYDGAIQWLQMAKKEIKKNAEEKVVNWSTYSHNIGMAIQIFTHLQDTLNYENSEELSEKLFDLYEFLKSSTIKANAYKEEKDLDNVIEILRNLKTAWFEISQKQKQENL
jgi:flagellar protein FliS